MAFKNFLLTTVGAVLLSSSALMAADFDWMVNLNLRSDSDPVGFRSNLMTRFRAPEAQLNLVMGNVRAPSDAYMVLRLAELSGRSPDYVLKRYKKHPKHGWGALAQDLGIKSGSNEFKALKGGHDMRFDDRRDDRNDRDKGHSNGNKEHGEKGH